MNRTHSFGRIGTTPLIVIAALAVAIGFWAGSRWLAPATTTGLKTAVMYPAPQAILDFQLTQPDGKALTQADLRGRWTVAFFGFTHCPDVCPNTLAVFKQVWTDLAAQGKTDKLRFDFISVDPERDTPEQLGRYVGFFHKDFIAATGSDEELTKLTRALGLVYSRVPDDNGSYTVDHSASVVIIDPQGRRAGLFRPPFEAGPITADLITLANSH
jgi:protein SCO1/2